MESAVPLLLGAMSAFAAAFAYLRGKALDRRQAIQATPSDASDPRIVVYGDGLPPNAVHGPAIVIHGGDVVVEGGRTSLRAE